MYNTQSIAHKGYGKAGSEFIFHHDQILILEHVTQQRLLFNVTKAYMVMVHLIQSF
jgi:hypothetical protein